MKQRRLFICYELKLITVRTLYSYFMEHQVMGEFVRILRISKPVAVSVQLLQTMSIMIQNLKSEKAICKYDAGITLYLDNFFRRPSL